MKHRQRNGGINRKTGTMKHRGYILEWAPKHPFNVKGYVYQHRLVMEKYLGRYLLREELVHHKNHQKDDNRPENLEVLSSKQHVTEHKGIMVFLNGEVLNFSDACKKLGRTPATLREARYKRCLSHQQVVDYYAKGLSK
jgi:hypothetical protein